jgi:AcrR family transcriptional regulator
VDGRRLRGDRTRRTVLARAVDLASEEGLAGLSLARLADEVGLSKSGIATLFGSKERLQLAVIGAAREIFVKAVIVPPRVEPRGLARLWALSQAWLRYSQTRVFDGGCFFRAVASEFDSRPSPVLNLIIESIRGADSYFEHAAQTAIDLGELAPETDAAQLRFEISALFLAANEESLLFGDDAVYGRALRGIRSRLIAAGAAESALALPQWATQPAAIV